jgi:hypothetical protein
MRAAVAEAAHQGRHRGEAKDRLLQAEWVGDPVGQQTGRVVGTDEGSQMRAAVAGAGHHQRRRHAGAHDVADELLTRRCWRSSPLERLD